MQLIWTEERHGTGVEALDIQHKELFDQVNKLIDAMRAGKGKQEVDRMLKFLTNYSQRHFHFEEEYMSDNNVSVAQKNKEEHQKFLTKFKKIVDEYNKNGATSNVILEVQTAVCKWLDEHIAGVDATMRD